MEQSSVKRGHNNKKVHKITRIQLFPKKSKLNWEYHMYACAYAYARSILVQMCSSLPTTRSSICSALQFKYVVEKDPNPLSPHVYVPAETWIRSYIYVYVCGSMHKVPLLLLLQRTPYYVNTK